MTCRRDDRHHTGPAPVSWVTERICVGNQYVVRGLATSVDLRDPAAECSTEIVDPFVRDFPGDEVAAVVVRGDVHVVVPGGAVAIQEMLDALLIGGDAGRVLVP